jgi:hypothetical protein
MENIDINATMELLVAIFLVCGFAAVFFKRTRTLSTDSNTTEQAPYKLESPVSPEPVAEVDQTQVVTTTKPTVKKQPVKKAPAKKTTKKKSAAE